MRNIFDSFLKKVIGIIILVLILTILVILTLLVNTNKQKSQLQKSLTNAEITQQLNEKFTQKFGIKRSEFSQLIDETKTLVDYTAIFQDAEEAKKLYSSAGTYFPELDEMLYVSARTHLNIIDTNDTKYPLLQKYYNTRKNDFSKIESFNFTSTSYDSDLLLFERKYDYLPVEAIDGFSSEIPKNLNIKGDKYFNTTENQFKYRFNSFKLENNSNVEDGYIHDLYLSPENISQTLYPTHQEFNYGKFHTLIHIPSQSIASNDKMPHSPSILCPKNPKDQKSSPYICQQTLGFSKIFQYNKILNADLVATILATDPLNAPTFTNSTTQSFSYIYDTLISDNTPSVINNNLKSRKTIFTFDSVNLRLSEIQLEINGKITNKITLNPTIQQPISDVPTIFSQDVQNIAQEQTQSSEISNIKPIEIKNSGCQPAIPNSNNFQLNDDRMAFDIQLNDVDITTSEKIVIYVKPDYGNYYTFWDDYAEFLAKAKDINKKYKIIIRYVSGGGDELSGIPKYYYAINCLGQPNLTKAFIDEMSILRKSMSNKASPILEETIKKIIQDLLNQKILNYDKVSYEKFEQILMSTDVANQVMNINYSNQNIKLPKINDLSNSSQNIHDNSGVIVLNENLQKVKGYIATENSDEIIRFTEKISTVDIKDENSI